MSRFVDVESHKRFDGLTRARGAVNFARTPMHRFYDLIARGPDYMLGAHARQSAAGWKPLRDNPTIDEVVEAISAHRPKSVLEVGCGWGRLTAPLSHRLDATVEGCDYMKEMLALCDGSFRAFAWDCLSNDPPLGRRWDVVFTRGVMQYFVADNLMPFAVHNILAVTTTKAIFWEWPEVLDAMRQVENDPRLEYREIAHRDE